MTIHDLSSHTSPAYHYQMSQPRHAVSHSWHAASHLDTEASHSWHLVSHLIEASHSWQVVVSSRPAGSATFVHICRSRCITAYLFPNDSYPSAFFKSSPRTRCISSGGRRAALGTTNRRCTKNAPGRWLKM